MVFTMVRKIKSDILVVGGGIAGLTVASEFAKKGYKVTLVEMDYMIGGIYRFISEGYEIVKSLAKRVKSVNVDIRLRTTFIGFKNGDPIVISPKGVFVVETNEIIMATGAKAPALAKLLIFGERPARIFGYKSVFRMLMIYNLIPGNKPIIYGDTLFAKYLYTYFINTGLKPIIISHNKNPIYIKDVGNEDVIYGKITGVYGKSIVQYIILENGSKLEGDSLIITMSEPNTLPIKPKYIDPKTNGPQTNYKFRYIESINNKNIYFIGDALAIFENPRIIQELSKYFVEWFELRVEDVEELPLIYDDEIMYIIPKFIPSIGIGGKLFIKLRVKQKILDLSKFGLKKYKVYHEDIISI